MFIIYEKMLKGERNSFPNYEIVFLLKLKSENLSEKFRSERSSFVGKYKYTKL